jgi:Flp pilus assembly protein CpaB
VASDATGCPNDKGNPVGSRRTLITIAALAVGALAVFLIYGYVGSVKDEAFGDAERVEVFIVKQTVAKGTYGDETQLAGTIVQDEIPKRFLPENAIRTFDDIAGKVAVSDLAVNQVVTTDMFADPSTVQATFSDRLEKINGEDQVAISIQVDQVRGVAGLLQPGDFVNIMLTQPCQAMVGDIAVSGNDVVEQQEGEEGDDGTNEPSTDGPGIVKDPNVPTGQPTGECEIEGWDGSPTDPNSNSASQRFTARYLMQKVQILAIDQTPVQLPGEAAAGAEGEAAATGPTLGTGLITLIVPTRAAQYIASVSPNQVYLTLVPRDYTPVPMTPIDPNHDPLPGEDPAILTPYGPEGPGGE